MRRWCDKVVESGINVLHWSENSKWLESLLLGSIVVKLGAALSETEKADRPRFVSQSAIIHVGVHKSRKNST